MPKSLAVLALCAAVAPVPLPAEEPPIQDNSFLIEEAYNQEAGVVQHISTWQRDREAGDWTATFTQEWPLFGQEHQLSYTLAWERAGGRSGAGDAAVHYRYQRVGDGDAPVAFAPRLSPLLPAGDAGEGRGAGAAGLEVNLPLSLVLAPRWVAHSNAGATWTPDAKDVAGDRADTLSTRVGQSLVWLVHPRLNLMLEALYENEELTVGPGLTGHADRFTVSPGLRGAWNLASGLQIVPGIAFPIGLGPSDGERALFLYLSFEHPFGR